MLPQSFIKTLENFIVELTWMHWNRLGARGTGRQLRCSVDPEILLLLTALGGKYESRLWEIAGSWLNEYEALIPLDRFKSLIKKDGIPPELSTLLRTFLTPTQRKRWEPFINTAIGMPIQFTPETDKEEFIKNRLDIHSQIIRKNYLLQLRYLFGPSIRADALYYILIISNQGIGGNEIVLTTSAVEKALSYDQSAIYRVFQSLEKAGVIQQLPLLDLGNKNKYYCLSGENPFFGMYARHSGTRKHELIKLPDQCYVLWIYILEIAKNIEDLIAWCKATDRATNKGKGDFKPLLIKLLNDCLNSLKNNAIKARLRVNLESFSQIPLKDISLDEMMKKIEASFSNILFFLETPNQKI